MSPVQKKMKIVCDFDGVLCANGPHTAYASAMPLPDGIARLRRLYDEGHQIHIHTSRLGFDAQVSVKWLKENNVPYHSIEFGKPTADLYIDDKAEAYVPNYGAKLDRKKLVICYSGGMDSLIAYYWAIFELGYKKSDVQLLNFNLGHPYAGKEIDAMDRIGLPYETIDINWPAASAATVDKYIIPGRNLLFATIAAGYGETVWIVGVKFENHPLMFDKNQNFFRTASLACSQAVGAHTVVETPFAQMSKTDMLRWAAKQGDWVMSAIHNTVSCYHPHIPRCGDCGLCFKRAIAIRAAGLTVPMADYAADPFKSDVAQHFIKEYELALDNQDFSHYQVDRIHETLEVMGVPRV